MKKLVIFVMVMSVVMPAMAGQTGWESFVIRNSNSGNVAPIITDNPDGSKVIGITLGGQKAGWGTNNMNGMKVGDISSLSITCNNAFAGWGPYFNIWITDGNGNYAVIANEPSHTAEYSSYGETAYNMTWDGALKNATAWVYEVSGTEGFVMPGSSVETYSNVPAGSPDPFQFEDFADYVIATPTTHWGGTGAPDDLNASEYTAYGFNWIFGDTQDNYLDGYLVSDPTLNAVVPVPGAILLGGLGIGLVGWMKKRKTL